MKCPNCDITLITTETIDHGWITGEEDKMWVDTAGYCPICNHKFLWTEYYTRTGEDNLEDDE